jgi:hypothetical protein
MKAGYFAAHGTRAIAVQPVTSEPVLVLTGATTGKVQKRTASAQAVSEAMERRTTRAASEAAC